MTRRRPTRWTVRAHRAADAAALLLIAALGGLYGALLTIWLT